MEEKRADFFGPVSEAIFIAVVTGGAYWLAFQYEAGYFNAFGIPASLIQVSFDTVLFVALAVSGAAWGLFWAMNLILMTWPDHPALQEKIFRVGMVLLLPFWNVLNYGLRRQDWYLYTFFLAFIIIFEFVWPILVFRDKKSLREKFIADEVAESKMRQRTAAGRILEAFGPSAYSLLLLFLLGSSLAHSAGRARAITTKEFFLLADEPNVAVIRMYSDTIIGVPFDRQTKTVLPQMVIRKIGNEKMSLILDANVGPLEVRKPGTKAEPAEPIGEPDKPGTKTNSPEPIGEPDKPGTKTNPPEPIGEPDKQMQPTDKNGS